MSLWWGSDPFAELVAKATSELLPAGQENIALNLEICDQVRAKQVPPKQAVQAIKRRVSDNNPNVVLLALGLTDICIKNGGDHFLAEVASRDFMDNLSSVLRKPAGVNHDVKAKGLRLIQEWAQISEAKPAQMGYIIEVYRSLKSDGFDFPARDPSIGASAAFVETLTAPEWVDGDVCMRCRNGFSTFNRKHHCRNCGNVFCQQCSSHSMSLPWYGVGQDVRVCDGCFSKKAPPKVPASASTSKLQRAASHVVSPSGRGGAGSASAQRSATLGARSTASLSRRNKREEDDLALAIRLSLQDAGPSSGLSVSQAAAPSDPSTHRATRQPNGRMLEGTDADDDPEMAAAIAASLREYAPPQPSAPDGLEEEATRAGVHTQVTSAQPQDNLPLPPSLDLPAGDIDSILTFAQNVHAQDIQNQQYGSAAAPPHRTQALYDRATAARPKMARNLDEAGRRHGVLMSMHDKLTEAVRTYDRLLDAQMSRPPHYAYPHQSYQQGAAQDYPSQQDGGRPYDNRTASPDPFPRQHYATHPHHFQQHPMYYHPSTQQQHAPAAQPDSMYPSLPSMVTGRPESLSGHDTVSTGTPYAPPYPHPSYAYSAPGVAQPGISAADPTDGQHQQWPNQGDPRVSYAVNPNGPHPDQWQHYGNGTSHSHTQSSRNATEPALNGHTTEQSGAHTFNAADYLTPGSVNGDAHHSTASHPGYTVTPAAFEATAGVGAHGSRGDAGSAAAPPIWTVGQQGYQPVNSGKGDAAPSLGNTDGSSMFPDVPQDSFVGTAPSLSAGNAGASDIKTQPKQEEAPALIEL